MYVDIPECRKCCCLPLRRGLLVFGYMGLIISLLWFTLEVVQSGLALGEPSITLHKGVTFLVQTWLVLLLNLIDIAFNIVLVIGAHKKNTRLLRIYFYYGATTVLAGFVLFLVTRADVYRGLWFLHIEEAAFAVFWFGLQIFIILLVRSEIRKLKRNNGLRFVNHISEVVVEVPPGEGNNPF